MKRILETVWDYSLKASILELQAKRSPIGDPFSLADNELYVNSICIEYPCDTLGSCSTKGPLSGININSRCKIFF